MLLQNFLSSLPASSAGVSQISVFRVLTASSRVLLQNPSTASSAFSARILQQFSTSLASARVQQNSQNQTAIKTPIQLIQAYEQWHIAITLFPPEIFNSCVCECISQFENHITTAIAD